MNRIFTYILRTTAEPQTIDMPTGARFLAAKAQGNDVVMWFNVDTSAEAERRVFAVVPTDSAVPADSAHFASVQWVHTNPTLGITYFVAHIFELKEKTDPAREP